MYGELWRKNAPFFGFKTFCLPKYQIPPLQTIYFCDQQSLPYLLSIQKVGISKILILGWNAYFK